MPYAIHRAASAAAFFGLAACSYNPLPPRDSVTTPPAFAAATIPLIIEGDQIFVDLDAIRPDGSRRTIIANVNMGLPNPGVQDHVFKELALDHGQPFSFRLGGIPISAAAASVWKLDDAEYPERQVGNFFSTQHRVEGWLQAFVLQRFELVLNYADKTMILAEPGSLRPEGIPVPIRVNEATGLVTVDVTVDGRPYPMVIDCGGAYTWVRPSAAAVWLRTDPERAHGQGAVGPANYNMTRYALEQEGTIIRLPDAAIGPMPIQNLGVMATGPMLGWPLDYWFREALFDWWQKGAPEPVIGWLGANVLKHYRLTIDYQNRMSYWLQTSEIDPHELDQVGVTLVYDKGNYVIGGIARKDGKATVAGVEIGDRVLSIDGASVEHWSRDQIFAALHGKPGDLHHLSLDRNGTNITLALPVSAF